MAKIDELIKAHKDAAARVNAAVQDYQAAEKVLQDKAIAVKAAHDDYIASGAQLWGVIDISEPVDSLAVGGIIRRIQHP